MLSRISTGRVTISVFRLRITISNVEPTLPDSVPDHKNQPYLMGIVSHAPNFEAKSWSAADAQIPSVQALPSSPRARSATQVIVPDDVPGHQNQPYLLGTDSHGLNLEANSWSKRKCTNSVSPSCSVLATNASIISWMTSAWPKQVQIWRVSLRNVKSLC